MTLTDVINANQSLARIKRKVWNTQYCTIPMTTTDTLYFVDEYYLGNCTIYSPKIEDLTATDWMNF